MAVPQAAKAVAAAELHLAAMQLAALSAVFLPAQMMEAADGLATPMPLDRSPVQDRGRDRHQLGYPAFLSA
jgi:hypothetical protein